MRLTLRETLLAGAAGAGALNLLHETARHLRPDAPRVDLIGRRALARALRKAGAEPPDPDALYLPALLGDLASNALYYSLVGAGRRRGVWLRGALLGLGAGLGTIVLPARLGFEEAPVRRTRATALMTVLWYGAGGLAAAAAAAALADPSD